MRILFAGTPKFAADHLQALIDGGREVVGVYTQPDRASGRGHRLAPSAVKVTAQAAGLPVEQPVSLRTSSTFLFTAASTSMAHFFRAGAGRPPFRGRSWRETTTQASL